MRSKKLTALLMTTALCATALFGCGKNGTADNKETKSNETTAEEKIKATLKVAAPSEDQKDGANWLKEQCDKFNEEHPNWDLTFEYSAMSEGDALTTVKQDPTAAADVYMFATDQIKDLVACEGIMPIVGDAAAYVKDTNGEQIVKNVTYNGNIYGIPYTANCWYMYYDKRVFSEEDVKNLNKMLEKGKVDLKISDSWYVEAFFLAAGCTIGDDENPSISLGGDNGAKAAQLLVDLYATGNLSSNGGVSGLGDTVNAVFSGSWDLANAREALGENLGIAAKPEVTFADGSTGQLSGFASAKAVGINPNCKNQKVAVELAKFLAGESAQKARYEARGVIPCNTALLEDDSIKNDEAFIAQNKAYDQDMIQPSWLGDADYWVQAEAFGKAVVSGEITKSNAAEKADAMNKAMNDKYAENKGAN